MKEKQTMVDKLAGWLPDFKTPDYHKANKATSVKLPPMLEKQYLKLTNKQQEYFLSEYKTNERNLVAAYLFWIFGGWYYLYFKRGVLWLLFVITGGGVGIWWFIDAFRMDEMVEDYNEKLATSIIQKLNPPEEKNIEAISPQIKQQSLQEELVFKKIPEDIEENHSKHQPSLLTILLFIFGGLIFFAIGLRFLFIFVSDMDDLAWIVGYLFGVVFGAGFLYFLFWFLLYLPIKIIGNYFDKRIFSLKTANFIFVLALLASVGYQQYSLQQINKALANLEEQVEQADSDIDYYSNEISDYEYRLDELEQANADYKDMLDELNLKIDELEEDISYESVLNYLDF